MPPPSTRLNSLEEDKRRGVSSVLTWNSSRAGCSIGDGEVRELLGGPTRVSTKVLHPWHSGQRPNHLRLSLPHCWQTIDVLEALFTACAFQKGERLSGLPFLNFRRYVRRLRG